MYAKPQWSRLGKSWPHHEVSRFVRAGGIEWHVQIMGQGPVLLLLHGTGAATHSWSALMPLLARHYTVVAPDLPGHGFTETPHGHGLSLPGMSALVAQLLTALDLTPDAIIGHSAGAAIGAQMLLDGHVDATHLIAINGAFKPFEGLAAHIFPVAAKLLVLNPLTIFALSGNSKNPARVRKLLEGTGSRIGEDMLAHYAELFATPGHVNGVMGMMARWDLGKLVPRLKDLDAHATLIVGTGDAMVPNSVSEHVAALIPRAHLVKLPRLGHLAHEEAPEVVNAAIIDALTPAEAAVPAS